jgi:hypothetical protein
VAIGNLRTTGERIEALWRLLAELAARLPGGGGEGER